MIASRTVSLQSVLAARFRANPRYELVLFDRLPSDQQAMLTDLRADPDFYGILRPRKLSGLAIKSVCRDTALLYLTLQEAGALPGYVAANRSPDTNQSIAEMVLDGVLEIMRSVDGAFVSGAEAYSLLYIDRQLDCEVGKLARLSTDALRYGQALEIEDAGKLSARLYFYNRDPASPRWLRDLPNEDAVLEWMGLTVGSPLWRRLRLTWSEVPASERSEGWRVWHRRNSQSRSAQTYFKLYVSPLAKTIPEAFARTFRCSALRTRFASRSGAMSMACCARTSLWRISLHSKRWLKHQKACVPSFTIAPLTGSRSPPGSPMMACFPGGWIHRVTSICWDGKSSRVGASG